MAQISTANRWGVQSLFAAVGSIAGGVNSVVRNIGVAIQISPTQWSQRVTKLGWRVDLSPDQPVGTLVSPTRWRVVIIQGQVPADVSAWQQQAYGPNGARLDIPSQLANGSPFPILHDEWLDFGLGAPGLNVLFLREFADGGPTIDPDTYLSALLIPLLDSAYATTPLNPAAPNAQMTLELWGTSATAGAFGGSPTAQSSSQPSLPRYGTAKHQGG